MSTDIAGRSGLSGRFALVTGGSRGIGRAIAQGLSNAGADVTITGRDAASLDAAVKDGVAARAIAFDIRDTASRERMVAAHVAAYPVDILVNNAGTAIMRAFEKQATADFSAMIEDHLIAPAAIIRQCLPGMKARGWGRIINIASTAGMKGFVNGTSYVAAKHAMLGLTRALALECARTGVSVNAICPGFTETDLVTGGISARAKRDGRAASDALAEFAEAKPLGRLVQPGEIAAAAVWLAGEAASAVIGQAIIIDGGEMIA